MAFPDGAGGGRRGPIISWRHRISALVVDEGLFFRTYERGLLRAYGAEAEAVDSGDAATDLIYAGRLFDLIVVDAHLTNPTGIQTTRQLRYMGVESVIVGITLEFSEEERRAFMDAGADVYIEKPFSPDKFVPILAAIDNDP